MGRQKWSHIDTSAWLYVGVSIWLHLNQTTKDWRTRGVTLSATKGISERFFAPLRMTQPSGHIIKCTNVMCFRFSPTLRGQSEQRVRAWPAGHYVTVCYPRHRWRTHIAGDSASCSIGTYLAASSMRRLRSSLFSSGTSLVVTRPNTIILPLGTKRSGVEYQHAACHTQGRSHRP